jgi:glycosyltransferase involved in cell wall biosynthesis
MKLSVIVPCYNEKDTIKEIIKAIKNSSYQDKEIIIVDDCSTDGTRELLKNEIESDSSIKIVYHQQNMGKGAALKSGVESACGDIIIIQDADLEYDPNEYQKILDPILQGRADVVFGSRFKGEGAHKVLYFWHRLANWMLTTLSNMLTNFNLTDVHACYKAFRSEIIKNIKLEEKRFGFDPEITAKISKLPNIRLYEVGISYYGRTYAEGKKISWKDGLSAIRCIIKYNLFRR